jgi:hypothetical protein
MQGEGIETEVAGIDISPLGNAMEAEGIDAASSGNDTEALGNRKDKRRKRLVKQKFYL